MLCNKHRFLHEGVCRREPGRLVSAAVAPYAPPVSACPAVPQSAAPQDPPRDLHGGFAAGGGAERAGRGSWGGAAQGVPQRQDGQPPLSHCRSHRRYQGKSCCPLHHSSLRPQQLCLFMSLIHVKNIRHMRKAKFLQTLTCILESQYILSFPLGITEARYQRHEHPQTTVVELWPGTPTATTGAGQ